ncbi:MAG: virulence factor family protein [bacterium]|nr:virulence factor family protein [bacterium]
MIRRAAFAATLAVTLLSCGPPSQLELAPFGAVALWMPSSPARRVVLLVSDDAGFGPGLAETARKLAARGAAVVGIDLPSYRRGLRDTPGDAAWIAADLEVLSQVVQRALRLPAYRRPVLVGIGAGGAFVYAAVAQGNPGMFAGAVSVGFCPTLSLPRRPGTLRGLVTTPGAAADEWQLAPAPELFAPWLVVDGPRDCAADAFVRAVPHAKREPATRLVTGVAALALAQFGEVAQSAGASVADLPLVEVPAVGPRTDLLAVILTGDGGWATIDRDLGNALAGHGIPVVGWSSLEYYWTPRTPDGAAADLARLLRHYLAAKQKRRVILAGYSRGADVLPFLVARLPDELRARVALVALLGPGTHTDFTFHLSDWLGGGGDDAYPVGPEVLRLRGLPILCVQGSDEDESLCPELPPGLATVVALPGGHHFGGDYDAIAAALIAAAERGDAAIDAGAAAAAAAPVVPVPAAAPPPTAPAAATGAGADGPR